MKHAAATPYSLTDFFEAIEKDDVDKLNAITTANPGFITYMTANQTAALTLAAKSSANKCAAFLLSKHDYRDSILWALCRAAIENNLPMVTILVAKHKENHPGTTAISWVNGYGHSPMIYPTSLDVISYLVAQGVTPTKNDCQHHDYAQQIKAATLAYYNNGQKSGRDEKYRILALRLRQLAVEAGVTKLPKYFEIAPKKDGILEGSLVISLSRKIDKPEGERIKYWMRKTNILKPEAGEAGSEKMAVDHAVWDIIVHQMAVALRGKAYAPKAKLVSCKCDEYDNIPIVTYVSRYLGEPREVESCYHYIVNGFPHLTTVVPGVATIKDQLKQAVSFALVTGDYDLKWDNIVIKKNPDGTPALAYGIDHQWAYSTMTFGYSDQVKSPLIASQFHMKLSPNYWGIDRLFGTLTPEEFVASIKSDALEIQAHNYRLITETFAQAKDDMKELGANLHEEQSGNMREKAVDYTTRALNWVAHIEKRPADANSKSKGRCY